MSFREESRNIREKCVTYSEIPGWWPQNFEAALSVYHSMKVKR